MQFKAKSKFLDISKSHKLYYILIIGTILCILSFAIYRNLIVTATMVFCTIISYIIFSKPPEEIDIKISKKGIDIGGSFLEWENCYAWTIVDLGEYLEFVLYGDYIVKEFQYFYLKEKSKLTKKVILELDEVLEYNQEITKINPTHAFLRNMGLA
jgi:hypothetical protein